MEDKGIKMKLSVAMIVKNEETQLAGCLDSVCGVDEIVIVDTGSTDKTKEIAYRYTNKVFDFPWIDDFAAARNHAREKCTGDWIISIDADERLDFLGVDKIREWVKQNPDNDGLLVKMYAPNNFFYVTRVFKNSPTIVWKGAIHELISTLNPVRTDIAIKFGWSESHEKDPDRSLRILENEYKKDNKNPRTLYYLAREYFYKTQWEKSIQIYNEYLPLSTWLPERSDAYLMKSYCLWQLGRGDEAREACMWALVINSNFKAAAKQMEIMSWEHNKGPWRAMCAAADNSNTLFAHNVE